MKRVSEKNRVNVVVMALMTAIFLSSLLMPSAGFAFVEQVMSYKEKYMTALGLSLAQGEFEETHEESSLGMSGFSLFGEVHLRRSPWALRFDMFSTDRSTGSSGLSVENQFREVRGWGLGFFEVGDVFSLYGGLGTGMAFSTTTMRVQGSSQDIDSQAQVLGGYLLGMRWLLPTGIFIDLYKQTTFVSIYPNGHLSAMALSLGYKF